MSAADAREGSGPISTRAQGVAAWLRATLAEVREFFLLREAEARASKLDEATVARLGQALALADQRREAAENLFTQGAVAEALRCAAEAFSGLDALDEFIPGAATGVDRVELRKAATELPTLDADVKREHLELIPEFLAAHGALASELDPLSVGKRGRSTARFERGLTALTALILIAVIGTWWFKRTAISVTASASWGGKFMPENVVDGDESTHWILPDGSNGWIELRFRSSRPVTRVLLLNGYEPPSYGVVDFRVEAIVGSKVVKATDGTFADQPRYAKQPWVSVPLVSDGNVDAIRIVVKSRRELGASLAEVMVP